MKSIKPIVEGLLFLSGDYGISIAELILITGYDQLTIENTIAEMKKSYEEDEDSVFVLIYTSNTYKLATKKDYFEYFKQYSLLNITNKLSQSVLETLAIIAYKQPITRFNIEEIKGVGVSHTLKTLIDKELVTIVGKSKEIGNPNIYGTTERFLDYVGINQIEDLPPLEEFKLDDDNAHELFSNETLDYQELSKILLSDQNKFITRELEENTIEELNKISNIEIDIDSLENENITKSGINNEMTNDTVEEITEEITINSDNSNEKIEIEIDIDKEEE